MNKTETIASFALLSIVGLLAFNYYFSLSQITVAVEDFYGNYQQGEFLRVNCRYAITSTKPQNVSILVQDFAGISTFGKWDRVLISKQPTVIKAGCTFINNTTYVAIANADCLNKIYFYDTFPIDNNPCYLLVKTFDRVKNDPYRSAEDL